MRLALVAALVPSVATAAPAFDLARVSVEPSGVTRAQSRTIYLNRRGASLTPGVNDSRKQQSSIVPHAATIRPWAVTDADWATTVACMRDMWSRFDVTLTDVDPGTAPHIEALFGGSPADVGMGSSVGGVSPFTADCGIVENSIVFAFTDNLPKNPQIVCEVMTQEIAHSYGLDHELLAADPMTYLAYSHDRAFQDVTASCGEHAARPCGIDGSTCRAKQNSVQLLLERLGAPGGDNTPPTLAIAEPAAGDTVAPGFLVRATAADNVAVATVTFYVDGERVAVAMAPPFELATDAALTDGTHVVTVEAADARGNTTVADADVLVRRDADDAGDPLALALGCSAGSPGAGAALALALVLARRRASRDRRRASSRRPSRT